LLPNIPASVGVARRTLGADLRAHGIAESAVGDAALVLSELLSNSIRYAQPLPGAQIRVTWRLNGGTVEVTVSDGGGLTRPHPVSSSPTSLGGRGLSIVEHLARRWGVRDDGVGTTVWAELPTRGNTNGSNGNGRAPAR
jgi:anti-sigma regulatory factor (Ser/Thr protein kinase)